MLTLVAFIACLAVLAGVVYLAVAFVIDLALRAIARLPAPAQDRLLRTGEREPVIH